MKTQILNTTGLSRLSPFFGLAALTLACAAMTGCFSDSGNNSTEEPGNNVVLQGRLQGDEESGSSTSSGWQGTLVTMHHLNADGSLSGAEDSSFAENDGDFHFNADLSGHQELIFRSEKNGQTWMSRHEGDFQNGETENTRPLDLESTLETAVWIELHKTAEGRQVKSHEVSTSINADVALNSRNQYRGSESSRNSLVANLATSIKAAARARATYLSESGNSQNASQTDADVKAAEETMVNSMYGADGNQTQERQAEEAYLNAVLHAYVQGGAQRTSYARSSEAAYHAMIHASSQLSDSSRNSMARSYATFYATASDTSTRDEFRRAGSSQSRIQLMGEASTRFRNSVRNSNSRSSIDSAMVHFRSEGRAVFTGNGGSGSGSGSDSTSFTLLTGILSNIVVSTQTDSLSLWLRNSLTTEANSNGGNGGNGQGVGHAFAQAHTQAYTLFRTQQQGSGRTEEQANAAANLMAFLSVRSSGSN